MSRAGSHRIVAAARSATSRTGSSAVEKAYTWMRGRAGGVVVGVGVVGVGVGVSDAVVDVAATAVAVAVAAVLAVAVALPVVAVAAVTPAAPCSTAICRRARPTNTSRKSVAFWGRFMMTSSKGRPRATRERMKSLGGVGEGWVVGGGWWVVGGGW